MRLYDNPASPFCRKVRVLALETGQMDQIEIASAVGSPTAPEGMPVDQNPLGKIPALIAKNGEALYDSRVICRYLDDQAEQSLYPSNQLYSVLRLEALADGIMDAGVLMVYEFRCRPEGEQSASWVDAQWDKITRALDHLEANPIGEGFHMGHAALACALGYLDFRHDARGWRDGRPQLAKWFREVSERPSLMATKPEG